MADAQHASSFELETWYRTGICIGLIGAGYVHLTFKQHRAAHRGCGTKGVPAAGVSEASEMLLLVAVVVLLLVVGFQLIRGLFFRGGMGMGG